MQVSADQIEQIRKWAAAGMGLSALQKHMEEELGIRMTYMQVRFLMDDHGIELESPKPAPEPVKEAEEELPEEAEELEAIGVSVSLDKLTRPGSVVSGDVRFSDGISAKWYLDQMGRLGLDCADKEYRPSAEDVQEFQMELQRLLQEKGF